MKRLLAILINQRPIDAGEWQQISPYGVFPHAHGRQKVTRESAVSVALAFNTARNQASASWRGVPVFIGHPPTRGGAKEQKGPFPRIGAVMEVDVRGDGLWGKVAWNDQGKQNAEQGYHVYPSPAWFFNRNSDGSITPAELDHIGMTNDPNIEGVAPWTNSESEADGQIPDSELNNEPTMDKKLIARLQAALKLKEDADGEAICNAVDKVLADIASNQKSHDTKVELLTNEKTTLSTTAANEKTTREKAENDLKASRTAHTKTLLDVAVNEGRITLAQRKEHETAFEKDFDVACNALAAIKKPARDVKPVEIDLGGSRRSIATNEERSAIITTAVNERMEKDKVDYTTAFQRVKADPKYAVVFEAMAQPGKKDAA